VICNNLSQPSNKAHKGTLITLKDLGETLQGEGCLRDVLCHTGKLGLTDRRKH